MSRDYIRMRSTTEREKKLARAREAITDEDMADSKVIDAALDHLAESVANAEDVKREISPELAEKLSTSVVRLTMYPQVRTD
jgi:hypothetical protein